MAITQTIKLINEIEYVHTYSSEGCKIKQIETDLVLYDAVDINPSIYTYEETTETLPTVYKTEAEKDIDLQTIGVSLSKPYELNI